MSIVITTLNRKDVLLQALESCLGGAYGPLEVLVYDDASGDGTEAAVRDQFPDVRYHRSDTNVGLVELRDRGLHDAQGQYVFFIHDDAYYADADTIALTVQTFREKPAVGAVAIPFIEPNKTQRHSDTAFEPLQGLRSYVGCAHALDRKAALEAGGYRGFFFRQGEERDLCIRLLDPGRQVVYGQGGLVVHLFAPMRSHSDMSYYGVRNQLLHDYLNVPHPYALPLMLYHSVRLFHHKQSLWNLPRQVVHVGKGWRTCIRYARLRKPVSRATFHRLQGLPSHGPLPARGEYAPVRLPSRVTGER